MSIQELEARIGTLRADGVQVTTTNMSIEFLSRGMLVRVSVHGAGIFDRQLRFEELGIKADDPEMKEWIKPGVKSYAPAFSGQLHSWATQCRNCLARFTTNLDSVQALTASTSWRFLLFDAYDLFVEKWGELTALRDKLVGEIEQSYPYLVEEALRFYHEQAERSWQLIQSRYGYGTAIVLPGGRTFGPDDKQLYLDWVAEEVRRDFPSLDKIRTDVYAEYWTNVLFDTASLAQAEAEHARAQQEATEARTATAEAADRAWQLQATRSAREEAIKQAEMDRARARLADTVDPFAEAMDQLLKEMAGHINSLLSNAEKNGSFRGRSLDLVDKMQELYTVMGGRYLDNDALSRTLADLKARRQENPEPERRDTWTNQIISGLTELRREVTDEAEQIEKRLKARTRARTLDL